MPQRESSSRPCVPRPARGRLRSGRRKVPRLGTSSRQHPLRWLARRWSRQLAAAQTIAVVEAGGRSVSLGDILGPEFAARPSEMFGPDRFHPSAAGYAAAASVLLPAVCIAAGLPEPAQQRPAGAHEESVLPVAQAAVEAVDTAGTEVEALGMSYRPRPGQQCRIGLDAPDGPCCGAVGRSGRPATARATARSTTMGKHPRRTATSLPHELTESGV